MSADDAKPKGELIRPSDAPPPASWAERQVGVFWTQLGQFRYLAADVRKVGRWLTSKLTGRPGA
jgi:hypothetical protein